MRTTLRTIKRIWVGGGLLVWIVFVPYLVVALGASDEAEAALTSGPDVSVTQTPEAIVFEPLREDRSAGLVFFAGALVDPVAYAPPMRALADHGYVVAIIPLPLRLAPTATHEREAIARALGVMRGRPEYSWVVGGHSKGAAIAASLARSHTDSIDGLLLVASSHPREFSLADVDIPVLKISGSRDRLADPDDIQRFAANLPPTTSFLEIPGANHSQFGNYAFQLGDGRATIPRDEQQAAMLNAILGMLASMPGEKVGQ